MGISRGIWNHDAIRKQCPESTPGLDATTMLRRFTIQILLSVPATLAAFTLPTSFLNNVVQKNSQQTWCYFPATGQTKVVSCDGAAFGTVLQVHLNTTISIGYYAPDNIRLGGPEWLVPQQNGGEVTLCVSGRRWHLPVSVYVCHN